jgi:uncharacterized RDD family membrane protein YckC
MRDDTTYRLETPDNVELHFDLAGPGSRFCALCIDGLVMAASVLGLVLLLFVVGVALPGAISESRLFERGGKSIVGWGAALLVVALAVTTSAYHAIFEFLMQGQTPGKRAMKIRAISDLGTAMLPSQVIVRNVLRTVDFLPFGYALGGAIALLGGSQKRLGDLAAGTIVVKEGDIDYRAKTDAVYAVTEPLAVRGDAAELSRDEAELVRSFLSRREELLPSARERVADELAIRLFRRHGGIWGDAESYLERLVLGRHHER